MPSTIFTFSYKKVCLSNPPFFSIIIPCFNHGQFLQNCLDSIKDQSFYNWEAIIINDGSTDNSWEVGESFIVKDSRFTIINQSNLGLSASRNQGMEKAVGNFFLFLDADDWLESNCLEILVNKISNNPDFELYRFGYSYWTEPLGKRLHTHLPKGEGSIYPDILYNNLGPCHSIVINSDFARSLGGFDNGLKSCEDWDFWIRAGKMGGRVFSIPKNLVAYRFVLESMSRQPFTMFEALSNVSRRAFQLDYRLPNTSFSSSITEENFNTILNQHLVRCLGILIFQNRREEAVSLYLEELKKRDLEISDTQWEGLSSYLTWKYLNSRDEILNLFGTTWNDLIYFFREVGYSFADSVRLRRQVMSSKIHLYNHVRYGKFIGRIINGIDKWILG